MTRTHIFESWFRSRAVIQVIWTSQRNDIGVQFQSCHRRWDAVGFHFSTHHRTERRKAFKWWWINTTEAKMKEERDEACFMSGAYIVQLWWPWSRAAGLTFDIYEKPQTPTVLYCALSPSVRLYFIIFYSFSPPHQFWISYPSWWCHILWFLPAWRRPPFPWRWARWTDWARWPAWPTWRISTPSPSPGLPPPSLRWTQRPISPVEPTTSQWSSMSTRELMTFSFSYIEVLFQNGTFGKRKDITQLKNSPTCF